MTGGRAGAGSAIDETSTDVEAIINVDREEGRDLAVGDAGIGDSFSPEALSSSGPALVLPRVLLRVGGGALAAVVMVAPAIVTLVASLAAAEDN